MSKYTLWQRLRVRLFGKCYLECRSREGWHGSLPFYLAKCPKHGYFEDYVQSFEGSQYLSCSQYFQGVRMTERSEDPESHEYRIVGSWAAGNVHVEYKPFQPREPDVPFKRFVVKFRGEVWHVEAPSTEVAKRPFASEFLATSPRPEEVTVEGVE